MKKVADLQPGEGTVDFINNKEVAAFKKEDGNVVLLDAKCPHAGCTVEWNDTAKTWDCPCHGSRFSDSGEFIPGSGPAAANLKPAT